MSNESALEYVFAEPGVDPGMQAAIASAQDTLPLFWRELHWDNHRRVKALDVAVLKVAFSDDPSLLSAIENEGNSDIEYIWLTSISFDGLMWTGVVANEPRALQSIKMGELVSVSSERVADWTYMRNDQTMGGFTTQHLRSTMSLEERASFDAAQGMPMGDPTAVQLMAIEPAPYPATGGFLNKGKIVPGPIPPIPQVADDISAIEHPASENMASVLPQHLAAQPEMLTLADPETGFTMLHRMALAGATAVVTVLVAAEADVSARTNAGLTALDLATAHGWQRTIAALS